ncbi:hypothetical protein PAHAL_1G139900 [Panicum hallii]|jgi:hypothetical protein|uniref:Uncharacterized protein n=1 Tax=Panicum hallii TaxID=206008 RepID=A0A2T8KV74_9POAL|nr:hypothetical protein PAHAL_1G139900 [Panicum hallii]
MASTAAVVKVAAMFMLVLCVGSQLKLTRASNDDQQDEAAAAGSALLQKPVALELAEELLSGGLGCSPACSYCKALCASFCSTAAVPYARCLQRCISNNQCASK